MTEWAGRKALVTGAASGVGWATSERMAMQGAEVIMADVDETAGRSLADKIGARFVKLDVSQEAAWIALMDDLGSLDVLVNNAGIPTVKDMTTVDTAEWRRVTDVNTLGPLMGCRHALPLLSRSSAGAIVNVSSTASMVGIGTMPVYCASKAALNALTRCIAAHCSGNKLAVRCNTVLPGSILTPMQRDWMLKHNGIDLYGDSPEAKAAAARFAKPEQVADVIIYLASAGAQHVNGAEIIVDGMHERAVNP